MKHQVSLLRSHPAAGVRMSRSFGMISQRAVSCRGSMSQAPAGRINHSLLGDLQDWHLKIGAHNDEA